MSKKTNPAMSTSVAHKPVYNNIGEQLLDIRDMCLGNSAAPAARERFTKVVNESGLKTGVDSEGGYLVETDKSKEIIEAAADTGVLVSRCWEHMIGPDSDGLEYFAANDKDRSNGEFFGGIKSYRKTEYEEMAEWAKIDLDEGTIRVHDQYALLKASNRMLRDTTSLTSMIRRVVPKAFSFIEDKEIFEGTGVGQHLGIMNSDALITVEKENSQENGTILAINIVKMFARFGGNVATAAWFVNQDCTTQFPFMSINNTSLFVPGASLYAPHYGFLSGLPIIPFEHCETLGTKGDIVLGDFSKYMRVLKEEIEETESIHVKFLADEQLFRWVKRNNGQPMHDKPINPLKGSNTLSPFVALESRG